MNKSSNSQQLYSIYYDGHRKPHVISALSLGHAKACARFLSGWLYRQPDGVTKVTRFRGNPYRHVVTPNRIIASWMMLSSACE